MRANAQTYSPGKGLKSKRERSDWTPTIPLLRSLRSIAATIHMPGWSLLLRIAAVRVKNKSLQNLIKNWALRFQLFDENILRVVLNLERCDLTKH